uniref:Uncharacterized protein n=1 Tax=Aegilops tauschii subsp. strangulata TaxID=200361 RepID=A0A453ADE1_AEGTS
MIGKSLPYLIFRNQIRWSKRNLACYLYNLSPRTHLMGNHSQY